MTRELIVECLPALIPEHFAVDVPALHLHQSLKASEVALPEGLKLITEPGDVIALVQVPHEEKVEAAVGRGRRRRSRPGRARGHQEGTGREGAEEKRE